MASLQKIISWFQTGLFPTADQFRQTWLSYWHKSEKIPQSQVFGLQDSLDTLSTGMIYKEPVQNLSDLATTYPNPQKGWSVQVINEKNADGNSLIYQWDGTQWNNTGMVGFPADTVKKAELDEVKDEIAQLGRDVSDDTTKIQLQLTDNIQDINFTTSGTLVYGDIYGIDYSTIGKIYSLKATINTTGAFVRIYKVVNNVYTLVANLYNGNSVNITVEAGMTSLKMGSAIVVSGNLTVSTDGTLIPRVKTLEDKIDSDKVLKYPFAINADFKKGTIVYSYIVNSIKNIHIYGCRKNCIYYVKDLYKTATNRLLVINEVDSNGIDSEFARYQIAGATDALTIEVIEGDNITAVVDWSTIISSVINFPVSGTPLHELCLTYLPSDDMRILVPSRMYAVTGIELNIYTQMAVSNIKDKKINGIIAPQFIAHTDNRFVRYTPTDNSAALVNTGYGVYFGTYNREKLQKSHTLVSVRSTAGGGKTLNVLCIGGSTTEQGYYIEHMKNLIDSDANLNINLLGTINSLTGLPCEGRSGWRARTYFCSNGTADGKPERTNPFFNPNYADFDVNAFDVTKYMADQGYSGLDVVMLAVGGNDSAATEQDINYAKTYYDGMIAAFKKYNPNVKIGVWMYNGGYYRFEGNMLQIDINQALHKYVLDWYDGRENENIFIVPIHLNIDPLYDYPYELVDTSAVNSDFKEIYISDWVHVKKETGGKKMGDTCYTYIKYFSTL